MKKGQIVKELIKLGLSRGPALGLIRFHSKGLPEKIKYYKWLLQEGKVYSVNYLVKLAKSKEMGYYYEDYLRYKASIQGSEEVEKSIASKKQKHSLEEKKVGKDMTLKGKKKNIFNFIKDD